MDYSSDWLLTLKAEYVKQNKKDPIFISDWDVINIDAKYPTSIIKSSIDKSQQSSYNYLFGEDQHESKDRILQLLKSNNIDLNANKIALTVSATASLYLTILSLNKKGVKRFLVFTPVYYTILDTLNDIKATIIYFPLIDENGFQIDLQRLFEVISQQKIEAVVFSDPVYSAGVEMPIDLYDFLSNISNDRKIWIICDFTLGGLEWGNHFFPQFSYHKIQVLLKTQYSIFIDSISKRFLINGIKISVIIGWCDLILEIENYASQVYGGFSSLQIEFLKDIYLASNTDDLSSMIKSNVAIMKDNHEKLRSILKNTQYEIYDANSAYFTMIVHKELKTMEVDSKKTISRFLFEENMLAFPSFHFSFHTENKFGFRVNVFRDLSLTIPALEKCIRKDIKRLH